MALQQLKYNFLNLLAIILVIVVVMGCKDTVKQEPGTDVSPASDAITSKVVAWPKPDSYTEEIPIYDTFERLEPLFRFDNDTTYVVNFWATWCKPCIAELPYFEEFHAKHSAKKVKVVLVSLDFPKQVKSNLVPFVRKKRLQSTVVVLLDGKYNDWIDKVSTSWSGAIPATYIYKGDSTLLVGKPFKNYNELNEIVRPFL